MSRNLLKMFRNLILFLALFGSTTLGFKVTKHKTSSAWVSPSDIWDQLGFPIVPDLNDSLLSLETPSEQGDIDTSNYEDVAIEDGIIYGSLGCECGNPKIRIVGKGKVKARINDIPWTSAILEKDGLHQPFCGASLINDRYVVTAAHCVKGRQPEELVIWLNEEIFLLSNKTHERLEFDVAEIIRHPAYKGYTNDIALLKLNDTVKLESAELALVNPVCVPVDNSKDYAEENGTVAGWGRTSSGGDVSPELLKIDVPIHSNKNCIEKSKYKKAIRDTMMCAGHMENGGADACQGDSGGPLIVAKIVPAANPDENPKKIGDVLVGIVSWGFGCAEPFSPGVYTRVTQFSSWILENTRDAHWCGVKH